MGVELPAIRTIHLPSVHCVWPQQLVEALATRKRNGVVCHRRVDLKRVIMTAAGDGHDLVAVPDRLRMANLVCIRVFQADMGVILVQDRIDAF